jgi:hypothetical protein
VWIQARLQAAKASGCQGLPGVCFILFFFGLDLFKISRNFPGPSIVSRVKGFKQRLTMPYIEPYIFFGNGNLYSPFKKLGQKTNIFRLIFLG